MNEELLVHGAIPDQVDERDYNFEQTLGAGPVMTNDEWQKGFDIEKELGIKIPIKNQFQSYSCVGQSFAYYVSALNTKETGVFDEVSAKAIYSQVSLGMYKGAEFRTAALLIKNWGSLFERILRSYRENGTTDEVFMFDKSWLTPQLTAMAKMLEAKDAYLVRGIGIDYFARAIKDGFGMVAGVEGCNNGTWYTKEPQPPIADNQKNWKHALYFGKFGVDSKGKWVSTPNSWGARGVDPNDVDDDGWQKFRENWFVNENRWLMNPWVLLDKKNNEDEKIINTINMTMIKKQGEPTIYAEFGDVLVPFNTTWEVYKTDFESAKIIELSPTEFAKFKIASAVAIKIK